MVQAYLYTLSGIRQSYAPGHVDAVRWGRRTHRGHGGAPSGAAQTVL